MHCRKTGRRGCIPGFAEMVAAETKGGNLRIGAAELS
jgi:hypothetical protein